MNDKISNLLEDDFGFKLVLDGEEYDKLPAWKQAITDQLLELAMSYKIVKINLDTACKKTTEYAKFVEKFTNNKIQSIPVWSTPGDVEGLLLMYQLSRGNIERLIRLYRAG